MWTLVNSRETWGRWLFSTYRCIIKTPHRLQLQDCSGSSSHTNMWLQPQAESASLSFSLTVPSFTFPLLFICDCTNWGTSRHEEGIVDNFTTLQVQKSHSEPHALHLVGANKKKTVWLLSIHSFNPLMVYLPNLSDEAEIWCKEGAACHLSLT